jgi:hypothetical protein
LASKFYIKAILYLDIISPFSTWGNVGRTTVQASPLLLLLEKCPDSPPAPGLLQTVAIYNTINSMVSTVGSPFFKMFPSDLITKATKISTCISSFTVEISVNYTREFWEFFEASIKLQDFKKQRIVTCSSGLSKAANSGLEVHFSGITLNISTPSTIGNTNKWS